MQADAWQQVNGEFVEVAVNQRNGRIALKHHEPAQIDKAVIFQVEKVKVRQAAVGTEHFLQHRQGAIASTDRQAAEAYALQVLAIANQPVHAAGRRMKQNGDLSESYADKDSEPCGALFFVSASSQLHPLRACTTVGHTKDMGGKPPAP